MLLDHVLGEDLSGQQGALEVQLKQEVDAGLIQIEEGLLAFLGLVLILVVGGGTGVVAAGTGIRCNAIAPGFIVSAQNKALLFNEDGTPTARTAKILAGTPMGRFADSHELLGGMLFLTADNFASAVTGVILPIDCGFAAYSGV